jgi:hypothetical protein
MSTRQAFRAHPLRAVRSSRPPAGGSKSRRSRTRSHGWRCRVITMPGRRRLAELSGSCVDGSVAVVRSAGRAPRHCPANADVSCFHQEPDDCRAGRVERVPICWFPLDAPRPARHPTRHQLNVHRLPRTAPPTVSGCSNQSGRHLYSDAGDGVGRIDGSRVPYVGGDSPLVSGRTAGRRVSRASEPAGRAGRGASWERRRLRGSRARSG